MDELVASKINFVLVITGYDDTSAQTVHARHTFAARDLRPGHEFVDIHSLDENGMRRVDYAAHPRHPAGSPSCARRCAGRVVMTRAAAAPRANAICGEPPSWR